MKWRKRKEMTINKTKASDLMNGNFFVIGSGSKVKSLADKFHRYVKQHGILPQVFVWTKKEGLLGEVPLIKILHASDIDSVASLLTPVHTLHKHLSQQEILHSATKARVDRFVVIDDEEKPEGVIHAKDLLHLIQQQEHGLSLRTFAGVKHDEEATDNLHTTVSMRYRWLILNLGTSIFAALSVALFEDTISQLVILAAYMPIIAGMGGNAGTQTIAVMVRGLALGEIHRSNAFRIILKEIGAGFINGLITGILMAGIAIFLGQSPLLGLVIGIALVINLVVAGFFGSITPLILKRLHFDPALSASIFVTTATDVFGFVTFLGLATWILL